METNKPLPRNKDRHLDAPSEANRDKHINFLAEDEEASSPSISVDIQEESDEKRREEWRQGIEEGKRNASER